jgi:iron complex transport system permease protein
MKQASVVDQIPLEANKNKRQYKTVIMQKQLLLSVMFLLLVLLFIFDISYGPAKLSFSTVLQTIFHPEAAEEKIHIIVWTIRLPVSIMAILVGAGLAIAGMEMQTILNNSLASPYTLGISSAASFGAVLALVTGYSILPRTVQNFVIPLFAFAFSLGSSMLIYFIGKAKKEKATIILAGIAINFLFSALNSIFTYYVPDEVLRGITNWSQGSIVGATWIEDAIVLTVLVLTIPILLKEAWKLTSLCMGDTTAKALGINVDKLRTRILILASLITAISVCFVGTIGFVGLVSPYVAKRIVGEEQRFFIPASLITGALMLSISNILSKVELLGVSFPLSIITSIIGIPFLLILILQKKG